MNKIHLLLHAFPNKIKNAASIIMLFVDKIKIFAALNINSIKGFDTYCFGTFEPEVADALLN